MTSCLVLRVLIWSTLLHVWKQDEALCNTTATTAVRFCHSKCYLATSSSASTSTPQNLLQADATLNQSIDPIPATSSAPIAFLLLPEARSMLSITSPVLYHGKSSALIILAAESLSNGVLFLLREIASGVSTIWMGVTALLICLLISSRKKAEEMEEKFDKAMSRSQQLEKENITLAAEKKELSKDWLNLCQAKEMEHKLPLDFKLKLKTANAEATMYKTEAEKLLLELEELDDANVQKEKLLMKLKQKNVQVECELRNAVSRGQQLLNENQDLAEDKTKLQQDLWDMQSMNPVTKLQMLAEEGRIEDDAKKFEYDENKMLTDHVEWQRQKRGTTKVLLFGINQSMYQISSCEIREKLDNFKSRFDSLARSLNDS